MQRESKTHTDTHWKNRQTQYRRPRVLGSNLQPSCSEATLLAVAPPRLFLFSKRNLLWRRAEHKYNLSHLLHHFSPPFSLCCCSCCAAFALAAFCTYLKLVLPWSCCSLLLILECWGFYALLPPPHELHQAVRSYGSPPIAAVPSSHYVV